MSGTETLEDNQNLAEDYPNENIVKRAEACNFIKKEILAQVFSCEFCKISKNTFFTEHLWTTASVITWMFTDICILILSTKFVAQMGI